MFGYIKPVPAELKVKEYELYRSVYCGLCAALGRNTSCVSRLTLSYDFVFLAIVRMSIAKESGKIEKRRCAAHPSKRRAVLTGAAQLDYCARVSGILTYYKLLDDIADERGMKRFASRLLLPAAKHMKKRALRGAGTNGLPEREISAELAALSEIERSSTLSPDAAAEPFGRLMAAVCSHGFAPESTESRIAAEIGRHIGRFVYIADAADDLEADLKSGAYNPFRSDSSVPDTIPRETSEFAQNVRDSLTMELVGIERAVELIDFTVPEYENIIKNTIYLGLPAVIERILTPKTSRGGCVMEREKI